MANRLTNRRSKVGMNLRALWFESLEDRRLLSVDGGAVLERPRFEPPARLQDGRAELRASMPGGNVDRASRPDMQSRHSPISRTAQHPAAMHHRPGGRDANPIQNAPLAAFSDKTSGRLVGSNGSTAPPNPGRSSGPLVVVNAIVGNGFESIGAPGGTITNMVVLRNSPPAGSGNPGTAPIAAPALHPGNFDSLRPATLVSTRVDSAFYSFGIDEAGGTSVGLSTSSSEAAVGVGLSNDAFEKALPEFYSSDWSANEVLFNEIPLDYWLRRDQQLRDNLDNLGRTLDEFSERPRMTEAGHPHSDGTVYSGQTDAKSELGFSTEPITGVEVPLAVGQLLKASESSRFLGFVSQGSSDNLLAASTAGWNVGIGIFRPLQSSGATSKAMQVLVAQSDGYSSLANGLSVSESREADATRPSDPEDAPRRRWGILGSGLLAMLAIGLAIRVGRRTSTGDEPKSGSIQKSI